MADNPIILLHPVREPLDQTAVGALELLARMMLPMDTAERTLFWEGIVADIVSKGLLRGLSPQRAHLHVTGRKKDVIIRGAFRAGRGRGALSSGQPRRLKSYPNLDNFRLSPGQKDFAAPQGVR